MAKTRDKMKKIEKNDSLPIKSEKSYGKKKKKSILWNLDQELADFFCKGPDSKYFRLWRLNDLFGQHSTLPFYWESSHRQRQNKRLAVAVRIKLYL